MTNPLLVVLTGPSGTGKDSLLAALRQMPDRPYAFAVNATTRPPRPGEREGVDYHFVSKEKFATMVKDGELLEHATVYGQEKGVLRDQVRKLLESGRDVLLRTDIQGARYIKKLVPGAVTIFIAPPSMEELERRMTERGGDSEEQVRIRLQTARQEMDSAPEFDHTVVNDDIEEALAQIEEVVERERARPGRKPTTV